MEERYRQACCSNELTRSSSGASSISVANSKHTVDKHTGWTNEKHNTFLDCLEASFVKQLHGSMALRAGSVQLNKSCSNLSEKLSAHINKASEQLPFRHDGYWKKIKTLRKPPIVYSAADSHDCLKYLGSDGHNQVLDSQFCCEPYCKSKRTRSWDFEKPAELQKTVTEGSGQNFVEEDFDENSRCKKTKTAAVDTADQEQIVPTRNMGVQELLVPRSRLVTE